MDMIGGRSLIHMTGLGGIFQSEEKKSMLVEALEEYSVATAESSYKDPGEQAPMGIMASGVEMKRVGNESN